MIRVSSRAQQANKRTRISRYVRGRRLESAVEDAVDAAAAGAAAAVAGAAAGAAAAVSGE